MSLLSKQEATADIEVFIDKKSDGEILVKISPLNIAEFVKLFETKLRDLTFVMSKFDTSILNESYWEPVISDETETVKFEFSGVILNDKGQVFNVDHCPPGRLLKDELNVSCELLLGNMLKVNYEGFSKIASQKSTAPMEWIAFEDLDSHSEKHVQLALSSLSFASVSQRYLYSSNDNRVAKIIFTDRKDVNQLIQAVLRSIVIGVTDGHVAFINKKTLDDIFDIADKLGFAINGQKDFVNKDRSYELTLNLGKTRWGVNYELFHGDERLLVYYDRTSGIWAMVS